MKALTKYLENRKDSITALINKPIHTYTSDTFHQLRIEIKKLNAFIDLIKFCAPDFKRKKTAKPFKLLFRQAGKVRELQLQEEMIKKYHPGSSLKNYITGLKRMRLKEEETYFLLLNKKNTDRLKKNFPKIISSLPAVTIKKAHKYLEQKNRAIQKLISQSTQQTNQVHELRKQLKNLNYTMKSLSMETFNKPLSMNDDLPELLGEWHDFQAIIQHLIKSIDAGFVYPKEIVQLEKLKIKLRSISDRLFEKITKALSDQQTGSL
ncbi:CHAD domain-containing protein [Pedobacter sp. P351]|uniref:CHAD domain-containing protein n=1 Tax=Pedobacter superstes TaxID=3133441 RepID=UPI0030A0B750